MTTQTPRPGEIWRHYKGIKHCSVLGVSTAPNSSETVRDRPLVAMASFTDSDVRVSVWADTCGGLWHLASKIVEFQIPARVIGGPLVVYACSGNIWVRPVAEFWEKFTLVDFDKEQS
jgi:hypothetical protein